MLRIITSALLLAAPAIGVAAPLYVIVRSILNYRQAEGGRGNIALKALASLAAWFLASWGMFFMLFVTVFSSAHVPDRGAAERGLPVSLLILDLIYAAGGCGLVSWVRHKADHQPLSVFTEGAT